MARVERDVPLLPSLLDRLIDDEPSATREPEHKRVQTLRGLKQSVARDLEALLNTRQESLFELSTDFAEVGSSLVVYGLPDFTAFGLFGERDRARIRRTLENAIERFEPRLHGVRVTLDAPREHERALRFRVDALLRMDPAPEPVTFDTVLELPSQEYVVRGSD